MLKNVGANWVYNLAGILTTFILTPVIVGHLGVSGDGVWQIVLANTGLFGLLSLGVPAASVKHFTEHAERGDHPELNRTVGTAAGLYLIMGAAVLVIGAVWFVFFELVYVQGVVPETWRGQARLAYAAVLVQTAGTFFLQLPYAVMTSHHDFVVRNAVMILGYGVRIVLTLALLALSPTLLSVVGGILGSMALEYAVSLFLVRRRYPYVRIQLADFSWRVLGRVLGFSIHVLVLQLGIKLSFQCDALVIGAFLPAENSSFYNRANQFLVYLVEFVVGIGAVVMPMATALDVKGRSRDLGPLLLRWSKVAFSLTLLGGGYVAVLGPEFLAAWIDPRYLEPSQWVLPVLMGSCLVFLPARCVALPLLIGLGRVRLPAAAFLAAGLLNLGLSLLLVGPLGLVGVALGTALPNVLYGLLVLAQTLRVTGVRARSFGAYVLGRPLLGALPGLGLLLFLKLDMGVRGFAWLIPAGAALVALFGVIWLAWVYRDDPYADVAGVLRRIRGRSSA